MPIIDPVLNVEIDDVEYPQRASYNGNTYAFASLESFQQFERHPEQYADPSKAIDNKEE